MRPRDLLAGGLIGVLMAALACSGAQSPTPQPTATSAAPAAPQATATSPAAPTSTPQSPPAAAPAQPSVATPTPLAAAPSPTAPQPLQRAAPTGSISIAIVDVGPPQYYGYKLTWPYNERNTGLGIHETLLWFDGEELLPQIASSWEMDGTTLTLHIRDDVPFHDPAYGNVTAEDVVFTYVNNSKEGTLHTAASPVQRDYSGFEVVDQNTVRFTLREQVVTWPIGPRVYGIESKKLVEQMGEDFASQNAVGTGPYRVVAHVTDDHINLEAVPNHWRKTPSVATLRVLEVPEAATRVAMLKTGEADAIQIDLPFIGQVQNEPGVQFVEGRYGAGTGTSIFPAGQYYRTQHPRTGEPINRVPLSHLPWVGNPNDPASMESARNVRKAMSYAIDREGIIESILNGRGCPQYQYRVDACAVIWDDKWATPYDPDTARQMLAKSAHPQGFNFNFFIPTGLNTTMEEIGESIVPMWEEVGLRATIDKTAYSARRPTMLERTISDVWIFIHGGVVTPDGVVQQWHELGGLGVWNMGAEIPRATEIADAVLREPDWDRAWQKVAEGLDWLAQEQPVIQAVTWRDPMAIGSRISSWDMPTHPGRFPVYVENIELSQ